jgi:endoglucanase
MNLGNALEAPSEGAWGVVLRDSYFSHVKSLGFQSVRIPVRWSAHIAPNAPYTIDSTFFKRVQWAVDQALMNHLPAIINVHHFDSLMSNPEKFTPVFLGIWEQVASRFSGYGPELYFEICNEPNNAMTQSLWNNTAKQALTIIRKSNPNRSVIIGSVEWNSAAGLQSLDVPQDSFLIATFHIYEPFSFTHQGASWVTASNMWLGTRWRASRSDTAIINTCFDQVSAWAAQNKVPIYLGEFGAIDTADSISRTLYTAYIAKQAAHRGWSYAYWKYSNNFGIYDDSTNKVRQYLVDALLRPEPTFKAFQKLAAKDTLKTPDPGSEKFVVLDDFEDSLPAQNTLASLDKSCCFWNAWCNNSCRMLDKSGKKVGQSPGEFSTLVGKWGKDGNGIFAKEYLRGKDYPSLRLTASIYGEYNKDWHDLSALTSISFWAKGYGALMVELISDTIQNGYAKDNWGNFSYHFDLTDQWKHFVIPIKEFQPRPFSQAQKDMLPWSAAMKKVCAVAFSTSQQYGKIPNDSLEVHLDDIRLYGVTSKELTK